MLYQGENKDLPLPLLDFNALQITDKYHPQERQTQEFVRILIGVKPTIDESSLIKADFRMITLAVIAIAYN